jgi:hypothetical protein
MSENLNLTAVKNVRNIAVYSNEVSLRSVDDTITNTQRQNPLLVKLFSNSFFKEVKKQISIKKKIYEVYLQDLKIMQKEFNLEIEQSKIIVLDDEKQEYENTLVTAIAELSILISKLDIKMESIEEKIGENNENDY